MARKDGGLIRPSDEIDVKTRLRVESNSAAIGKQVEEFLKNVAGQRVGFVLMIETTAETSSYVSNILREDSEKMLLRTIENFHRKG